MDRASSLLKMPLTDEDFHDELDRPFINAVDHRKPSVVTMHPTIMEEPVCINKLAPPTLKRAPSIMDMVGPPSFNFSKPKAPRQPQLQKHNIMKRNMSVAKGFMDISLFSANANQLRTLLNYGDRTEYTYYIILTGLLLSLALQLIAGITLIVAEKFDLEDEDWSEYLNNSIVIQVFFIVIINVFISGFGVNVMSIKQFMHNKSQKDQNFNFINTTALLRKK